MNTTETITLLLTQIMDDVHPLMAEGLHLAAVPYWYNADLYGAMRQRDDGRNQGLIQRLTRYSFVIPLTGDGDGQPTYMVRADERMFLQRHWIAKDRNAYLAAHQQALDYFIAHPDPNPFAQAQYRLYHQLMVDIHAGMDYLVDRFRQFHSERQLTAIDNLLKTAKEARFYLAMLENESLSELDDLLAHLRARMSQLRGHWDDSLPPLQRLRHKPDLPPWLRPYVTRAYGRALAETGQFVEAMGEYETALKLFEQQSAAISDTAAIHAERAHTLIALGDASVNLALAARGHDAPRSVQPGLIQRLFDASQVYLSLPLMFYLSFYLGKRVWHPRFWPTLHNLDWLIARLFAAGARYYRQADPILEKYGAPSEGVAADEKLAVLYLALGDAEQAELLLESLLAEEEAPLGEYRRAAVRVGLGRARLRLGRYAAAQEQLELALPVLQLYEDRELQAVSQALLGETLTERGDPAKAVRAYRRSSKLYRRLRDQTGQTNAAERLEALIADGGIPPNVQSAAQTAAAGVEERHYPVRYRHPATVLFQRAIILLAALLIFLIPLIIIRIETGTAVLPDITFNASPLLRSDSPDFTPDLSQGVVALSLAPAPNPDVVFWLGALILLVELLLSTGIGIFAIFNTSLAKIQARARARAVHLSPDNIRIGDTTLRWADISRCWLADVSLAREMMPDNSTLTLTDGDGRLTISGNTAWYPALKKHILSRLPETAQQTDFSFSLLRSRLGFVYLATIGLIGLLAILGQLAARTVIADLPLVRYSLADLYPFLYLGLFIPPAIWFIIKPIQIRRHTQPDSRMGLWLGGLGLGLAVLRVITLFRPWLTVPDIYMPLLILILVGYGGYVAANGRHPLHPDQPLPNWGRGGVMVAVTAVFLLMGLSIGRETGMYHFMVLGDAARDAAQQTQDPVERAERLAAAVDAYDQSVRISEIRILGVDSRLGARIPLGLPRPHRFSWMAALNGRAAMQSQLGNYKPAIDDYTALLAYSDQQAPTYASRAIAYQGWGTTAAVDESGQFQVTREFYDRALSDFDQAIKINPESGRYYLWRGVAYHALSGDSEQMQARALADYEAALAVDGRQALAAGGRAKALTGEGWLAFAGKAYRDAAGLFAQATQIAPDLPDPWLGLGYAHYTLRQYDEALTAWESGAELDADNPTFYISLGTLYWRLGTVGDDYESSGTDRCTNSRLNLTEADKLATAAWLEQAIDLFTAAAEIEGQRPEDIGFTYRTRAQVEYLLRNCPGYNTLDMIQAAIDSYSEAITADSGNANYWQFRGRLQYSAWFNSPPDAGVAARERLFDGLSDMERAIEIDPLDRNTDYRPNWWRGLLYDEAVNGTLSRGDGFFAAREYQKAFDYYELVAARQPDQAGAAMQAGLAALALGRLDEALAFYREGIDRALAAGDETAVQTANAALQNFLLDQPNVDGRPVLELFQTSGVDFSQAQTAAIAFTWGEMAAKAAQMDDAVSYTQQGIKLALVADDLEAVAAAVLGMDDLSNSARRRLLTVFAENWDELTTLAGDETIITPAFTLGLLASAFGDDSTAGVWYNEGIRRAALQASYPSIRQSREDLKLLWTAVGVNSNGILSQIERQLAEQLKTYPDLIENALYWRYRAWFKYGLGLSAFVLDEERAAQTALASAQKDADAAYELDETGNAYVQSYMSEGAWGWYYIQRGDRYFEAGAYERALVDYETAVSVYAPNSNGDAQDEVAEGAFKSGLAAYALGDVEKAKAWYQTGLDLIARYGSDSAGMKNAQSTLAAQLGL